MKKKQINLNEYQKQEIKKLVEELQQHKIIYNEFKNFVKRCDEAIAVASALLNNDYATFKKYKLIYTTHTAEKMRGMQSLNTYKKTSSICCYLSQHGGICSKCYAEKSIKLYRATLAPVLIYNTLLLKYIDIDADQIPYTNNKYFRFESFSDLQGAQHLLNLIKVCKKNKNTIFTLWTKSGTTFLNMLLNVNYNKTLPNNLNIIQSAYGINEKPNEQYIKILNASTPSNNAIKYFIVFDNEETRKNSGFYLCKNKCVDCLKCYKKRKKDNILIIAEKLH